MTEFVWSETREKAIRLFRGQTPGAEVEQQILEAFMEAPLQVVAEIERVAKKFADGKIQSPWVILRMNVKQALERPDATVTDASERERRVKLAEQWISDCGVHCPSESELLGALFGTAELTPAMAFLAKLDESTKDAPGRYLFDGLLSAVIARTADVGPQEIPGTTGGLLAPWAGDEVLRARMVGLWEQERPRGQLLEAEMETRAAEFVLQRKVTRAKAREAA